MKSRTTLRSAPLSLLPWDRRVSLIGGFSFVFLMVGCGPKPGTEHVSTLREALFALDSAEAVFNEAPHDQAEPALAQVDSALRSVESMMVGLIVNLEQGRPFNVLDERRRMLRRQPGRQRRIEQELDRTRRQIGNLIEAIVDGATVDAEGTPIDVAYLDRVAQDELRIAQHLLEEMEIALEFLDRGLTDLDGIIQEADSTARYLSAIPASL